MDETQREAIEAYIQRDPLARKLGVEVEILGPGRSRAKLTIMEDMANFHGMAHGGIIFALGDIAFAAASNSHGQTAVAMHVAITYIKPAYPGEQLTAEAREIHVGGRTGLYEVVVYRTDSGEMIARSEDMVYRQKQWFAGEPPEGQPPQ